MRFMHSCFYKQKSKGQSKMNIQTDKQADGPKIALNRSMTKQDSCSKLEKHKSGYSNVKHHSLIYVQIFETTIGSVQW